MQRPPLRHESHAPDFPLLRRAIVFAERRHFGQVRRGSGLPYITHPIAVSHLVAEFKTSERIEELLAAAVLHDVLEDTDACEADLAENFTPLVTSLVVELTNDQRQVRLVGKTQYQMQKLLRISSYALTLKLADRLHNVSDAPSRKMLDGTLRLMANLREHRQLSNTQLRLIVAIERVCRDQQRQVA